MTDRYEVVNIDKVSDEEVEAADKVLRFYGTTIHKTRIRAALEAAKKVAK